MLICQNLEGLTMVRASCTADAGELSASVILMDAGGMVGEAYMPAASVSLTSIEGIQALHSILGETLERLRLIREDIETVRTLPALPDNILG
jgi:hypothetical protein